LAEAGRLEVAPAGRGLAGGARPGAAVPGPVRARLAAAAGVRGLARQRSVWADGSWAMITDLWPQNSSGAPPPGPLPPPGDGGASRAAPWKLVRARRRPLKAARSRSWERPPFVDGSTPGQSSGALLLSVPLRSLGHAPEPCRGPIKTTRSGPRTR